MATVHIVKLTVAQQAKKFSKQSIISKLTDVSLSIYITQVLR